MNNRSKKRGYKSFYRWLLLVLICISFGLIMTACSKATPETTDAQPAVTEESSGAATSEVAATEATTSEEPSTGASATKVIKIGLLAPLTGQAAADGEDYVRGTQLAVDEINAKGGVAGYTFEIVTGDTKDQTPDAVTSAVNRLMADPDVKVMMTGYASNTNFEIKIMADNQMPYLLSAQSAQTREIIAPSPDDFPTVWSITPSYDAYNTEPPTILEQWASEGKVKLNNRKVAIVTSDNAYSKTISDGLKAKFTELGWTITVDEMVPFQEVLDWRTILAKIRQDPPDLIVNTDYLPGNSAAFLNQFLEDPTDSYVFLQYAPSTPEFIDLTGEKADGVLFDILTGVVRSSQNTIGTEFLEKFKKAYGVDSGVYGSNLYDSVYLYAGALEKVGNPDDRLAIGKAIGESELISPAGKIKFDPLTHLAMQSDEYIPLQFYQIWDKQRILISPTQFAEGEVKTPPWFSSQK